MRVRTVNDVVFGIVATLFALVVLKYVHCRLVAKRTHDEARQRLFEIYRIQHPENEIKVTKAQNTDKKDRIVVNVMVCDNTAHLKELLSNITRWTSSDRFGVAVSLGCDNEEARGIAEQFNEVIVLEPEWRRLMELKNAPNTPPTRHIPRALPTARLFNMVADRRKALLQNGGFEEYKRVSNQYKHSLTYSFDVFGYDFAVFIEEGSFLSNSFFDAVCSGAEILSRNPGLFCFSAWNENHHAFSQHKSRLHETDLFTGVGWMITSATWSDLIDEWPIVFWDEWLNKRMREQGKHCIRPSVSQLSLNYYRT